MAERLPRKFGRYELLSVIMRDGFGTIYRARDEHFERDVWLRVLDASLASDAATADQFERGARLASTLHHANLPLVYEVGAAEGLPFMSFQPIEGISLAERLLTESPIFPLRAAFIVSQLADALSYLHERWLAHGNVTDQSVWLSADDQVTLLDLGMAPGVHTVERDTESLANLAHEMVVGAPFSRTDDTMRRPGIPWRRAEDRLGPEMWGILMRGVRYEGEPYTSVQSFRDDFVRASETAEPPPRENRRQRLREQRARSETLCQQAGAAARLGQWERVTEVAGHALRLNPKNDEARQWLRRAARVLGGETPEEVGPLLRPRRRRRRPAGALLAVLVVAGATGGGIWALTRPHGNAEPPPVLQTATPSPWPTWTAVPTNTVAPTAVPSATPEPPSPTATRTSLPPPSPTTIPPSPVPTGTATAAPVEPSPEPSPTTPPIVHAAPTLLSPVDNAYFAGDRTTITLEWSDVGPLAEDEWYVVRIPHPLGEEVGVTRETHWQVPAYMWLLRPASGRLSWSVSVRVRTSEAIPGNADEWPATGAESSVRSFVWAPATPTPSPTPTPQ